MVRKTLGVDKEILNLLTRNSAKMSPADIVYKLMNNPNPPHLDFNKKSGIVRYHLKMLVEQGKVKKEKIKNGFVYFIG